MTIFVVGFPKSGNTWLAKMLCQTFNAFLIDDDPAQLEVNDRLDGQENDLRVVKAHYLPEKLFSRYPTDNYRVFYMYRDFRDVSISSWFYFNGVLDLGFQLSEDFSETIVHFDDPSKFRAGRLALKNYVSQLSRHGVPKLPQFSTWSQHIETWLEWGKRHPNKFHALTYSQLLADTETHLTQAFKMCRVEQLIQSPLHEVVQKESFKNLKSTYRKKKLHANASFLRSGSAGDWKNYYTQEMANGISDVVKAKLTELRFETNENWIYQLRTEKLGPETILECVLFWKLRLKHMLSN